MLLVEDGHDVHNPLPEDPLYLPAAHCVHIPGNPVLPAGQSMEQSSTEPLPAGEVVPGGQYPHVAPVVAPSATENLPSLHLWQVPKEVAPDAEEYLPEAQRTQDAVPSSLSAQ
jgi:hypothetical protein